MYSFELTQLTSVLQQQRARVVADERMSGRAFGDPVRYDAGPNARTTANLFFHNAGGISAKEVTARYTVPAGLRYVDAFLTDPTGKQLGES